MFKRKKRKIGLALGGGGARGLAHIKFLEILDKYNLEPTIISGTSIGALIGAAYCSGIKAEKNEKIFLDMNLRTLSKLLEFNFFNKTSLFKLDGIKKFISNLIEIDTFSRLEKELRIVTTDFWRRKQVVFSKGDLLTPICASIAIPGVFSPVRFIDKILVDGGLVNPVPYDIIKDKCDFLIAIDVLGQRKPQKLNEKFPSISENLTYSFEILEKNLVAAKLENFKPDFYIQPNLVNISLLDFYHYKKIFKGIESDVEKFEKQIKKIFRIT